ncbi:MAG TPA: response regulator transcription factor [Candidatus Limnocylindria bacterium]|jgi:two-component system response regulator MprA
MASGAPFRVLVVEDDPALRQFTVEWLTEAGYEARVAENGAEALGALGWGPDLILLDLTMPVMDGLQFLDRLTAAGGAAADRMIPPVIVLSGTFRRTSEMPKGAAAMLEKPFDFDLLGRSIATYAAAASG